MATIQDLITMGYTPQQAASLMGKSGGNSAVMDAIMATAARAGMDPAHWRAFASVESGLDPGANANKATQYKGLFQLGTSEFAKHGQGSVYDPMANARAAAELAYANNQAFMAHFGRAPTPAETYLMHNQGLGFFTKGTMTNIAGNLPEKARIPENMTHEGFQRWWTDRIERGAGNAVDPRAPTPVTAQGSTPAQAALASAAGSTTPAPDATPANDLASKMAGLRDTFAKQDEAYAAPELQPMNIQPLVTPAMQRARMIAQAMLNKDATS